MAVASSIIAGIGAAASVGSAISGSRASRDQNNIQQQALEQSRTTLNPFSIQGLGGAGASYGQPLPGQQPDYGTNIGLGRNFSGGGYFGQPFFGGDQIDGYQMSPGVSLGAGLAGFGGGGIAQYLQQFQQQQRVPQAGIQLGAGDLAGPRAGLVGFANNQLGMAQQGGIPYGVQRAANIGDYYAGGGLPQDPSGQDIGLQADSLRGAFQGAYGSLSGFQGVAPGLANTAFRGAGEQAVQASQGFSDLQAQTLSQLRSQAQPFEQRAYDQLQNDLFSSGRGGTTGGGIQTEAFARGLGQADLSRQLAASGEARQTGQYALGQAQGLGQLGGGISSLNDQLLGSAFNNFSNTSAQFGENNQRRLGNSILLNDIGFNRNQQNFSNQVGLAGLGQGLQGGYLNNALTALGGQSNIQQQLLNLYNSGLQTEQAAAAARVGAGQNAAAIAGSPNFTSGAYGNAQLLGQLGAAFAPQGGYINQLQGLFGGGNQGLEAFNLANRVSRPGGYGNQSGGL